MGDEAVPQPDNTLRILKEHGGKSWLQGDYPAGAPELIVEVAVTSASYDLGEKMRLYQRKGVQEYLVVLVKREKLIWHQWAPRGFRQLEPDPDGITRSRCFPGLWLDTAAFWRRDMMHVQSVLQQGLASAEHAAFVARLAEHT